MPRRNSIPPRSGADARVIMCGMIACAQNALHPQQPGRARYGRFIAAAPLAAVRARTPNYATYWFRIFCAAVSDRMSFEPSSIIDARASRNSFSTSISFVRP